MMRDSSTSRHYSLRRIRRDLWGDEWAGDTCGGGRQACGNAERASMPVLRRFLSHSRRVSRAMPVLHRRPGPDERSRGGETWSHGVRVLVPGACRLESLATRGPRVTRSSVPAMFPPTPLFLHLRRRTSWETSWKAAGG